MKFLVFLSTIIVLIFIVRFVRGIEHYQDQKIDNIQLTNRLLDLLLRTKQRDLSFNQPIKFKYFDDANQFIDNNHQERTCKSNKCIDLPRNSFDVLFHLVIRRKIVGMSDNPL